MKINDSGMPDEEYWDSLFNINKIITWLGIEKFSNLIIEVGCGYGTFTLPIADKLNTRLCIYDIEQEMIDITKNKLAKYDQSKLKIVKKDVVESGFDEKDNSCSAVLLFNILHFKERKLLLNEAMRVISRSGEIAIIHWRKDIPTPRGPSLDIRPTAEDIIKDGLSLGLSLYGEITMLEPYHWGIKLRKEE